MSRKTKRADAKKRSSTPEPPARNANPSEPAADFSEASNRRLLLVAAIVVVWWLALILMVAFTANPVTLNRRQFNNSAFVVTGKVVDLQTGRVEVDREWKTGRKIESLTIAGLSSKTIVAGDAAPVEGETYIFPLRFSAQNFRVTSIAAKEAAATIYPATKDTRRQLAAIYPGE